MFLKMLYENDGGTVDESPTETKSQCPNCGELVDDKDISYSWPDGYHCKECE